MKMNDVGGEDALGWVWKGGDINDDDADDGVFEDMLERLQDPSDPTLAVSDVIPLARHPRPSKKSTLLTPK
ncbi:hypothetical protein EW146_g4027 [Bondarzewia mesenterica]|uniref:Uncharacterized protein n=1 Tax=Bondarzewia mesenterica TaxID=1095465 RepID=A0A4S4LWA7_9AGAM|nr:hypothetical protein EW146_g4027 [Bondarzewia mesenterica]